MHQSFALDKRQAMLTEFERYVPASTGERLETTEKLVQNILRTAAAAAAAAAGFRLRAFPERQLRA